VHYVAVTDYETDGPLLQRASTVATAPIHAPPVHLDVAMAQQLPFQFDGSFWTTGQALGIKYGWTNVYNDTIPIGPNRNVSNHIVPWAVSNDVFGNFSALVITDAPLSNVVHGCPKGKTCKATIQAPALSRSECYINHIPMNYTALPDGLPKSFSTVPSPEHRAFMVASGLVLNRNEKLYISTGYYEGENCQGTFHETMCVAESAVGEYEISVRDGVAFLDNAADPKIVAVSNNTAVSHQWNADGLGYPSLFSGIAFAIYNQWNSIVSMYYTKDTGWDMNVVGQRPLAYIQDYDHECPSFSDPTSDVVESLNKMMVYAGM
jgi:hypothetical protein